MKGLNARMKGVHKSEEVMGEEEGIQKILKVDWLIDTRMVKQKKTKIIIVTSTGSDHWNYGYYFNYTRELTLEVIWGLHSRKKL